jgi:hypothetical protein
MVPLNQRVHIIFVLFQSSFYGNRGVGGGGGGGGETLQISGMWQHSFSFFLTLTRSKASKLERPPHPFLIWLCLGYLKHLSKTSDTPSPSLHPPPPPVPLPPLYFSASVRVPHLDYRGLKLKHER